MTLKLVTEAIESWILKNIAGQPFDREDNTMIYYSITMQLHCRTQQCGVCTIDYDLLLFDKVATINTC